jgi:hypothetical protein
MVLWQKFGEEILDFDQVMRMGKSDATIHRCLPARTGEDHVWFEDRWMVASLCDE